MGCFSIVTGSKEEAAAVESQMKVRLHSMLTVENLEPIVPPSKNTLRTDRQMKYAAVSLVGLKD